MQTLGKRNFSTQLNKKQPRITLHSLWELTKNNSPLSLGTYKELIDLIVKDFSPYDAPKDAIYEMKELKMGNTIIQPLKNMLPSSRC